MASLPEDYQGDEKDEKKEDASAPLMADGDMDKILADIEAQPLVSGQLSLDVLLAEFSGHQNYERQMKALIAGERHRAYRQMRRDGNCFYRAFLLGLFETIESRQDQQLLARVTQFVTDSLHRSLQFGFEGYTIEDFYYAFMDELAFYQQKLSALAAGQASFRASDQMGDSAIERMSSKHHAQYLIFWARMLASLHMRAHQEDFEGFVPADKGGFAQWLRSDVEALNSEADHLQAVALSKALQVPVTLYCLENVAKGGPSRVATLGEGAKAEYDLLFRPGHYDLLYRNKGVDDEDEQKGGGALNAAQEPAAAAEQAQAKVPEAEAQEVQEAPKAEETANVTEALPNNGNT